MTRPLSDSLRDQHETYRSRFGDYREKLTEVLFYGDRISRSELTQGKNQVLGALNRYVEVVREVLLPAVANTQVNQAVSGVELFADLLDRLLMVVKSTEDNIDFFANPDAPKEDRNDAAREVLKDLYRLDSIQSLTLNLLEEHLLKQADDELTEDECEELLIPLSDLSEPA